MIMGSFFKISSMNNFKFLIIVFLFFLSCKKENDPALILISPLQNTYYTNPDKILTFDISCSSNTNLSHLIITSKTETTFSEKILDTLLSSKNFEMTYQYKAPVVYDTTKITLIFTLTDIDGNKNSIAKIINVTIEDIVLSETAGHQMFSHNSTNYDAYNLLTGLPIHSQLSDSSIIHIIDASIDSINHNTLSRKWMSLANLKFVKFNDFNYANATISSIKNAYNAGLKNQFVDNLTDGDIIITKLGNSSIDTGFIAIKIINIIDADSTINDKYIFNIKK